MSANPWITSGVRVARRSQVRTPAGGVSVRRDCTSPQTLKQNPMARTLSEISSLVVIAKIAKIQRRSQRPFWPK